MKYHPIIFSGPMVRAILEGRKTQTRRIVKPAISGNEAPYYKSTWGVWAYPGNRGGWKCPYGQPGDRIWVREAWKCEELESGLDGIRYKADNGFCPIKNTPEAATEWIKVNKHGGKWKPSIHMPRWASRITLEISNIRIDRLHNITEEDANAEGINTSVVDPSPRGIPGFRAKNYVFASECFADLWKIINGPDSWESNPYVWVITFSRRVER